MANPKATKLKNFFNGNRRAANLNAWTHLKTKAGEDQIKLDVRLPLLNQNLKGMDGAIGEAFAVMAKDESKIERTSLNVELDGMTLDIFATDESKRRAVSSTGVRMQKLALVATGEAEKRELDLHMVAYIPASLDIRDWAWGHLHKSFWLEAVYSQSELDFEPEANDEDEELDPDSEDEPERKAKPKPKSGPKQLAEYHAAQPN